MRLRRSRGLECRRRELEGRGVSSRLVLIGEGDSFESEDEAGLGFGAEDVLETQAVGRS